MKRKEIITFGIGVLIGFVLSLFIVYSLQKHEDIKTVYVKGNTVRDTIIVPKPYKETQPSKTDYIYKDVYIYDTVLDTVYIQSEIDTLAIIEDWALRRDYKSLVFDNNNGKLILDLSVQYNNLQSLSYQFTPIQIKEIRKPLFFPFASASYSTFGTIGLGGGFFYNHLGIEYQYQFNNSIERGHLFGLKYRF